VENVSFETFSKVADWLTEHAGKLVINLLVKIYLQINHQQASQFR
jgi:hypothetical protein